MFARGGRHSFTYGCYICCAKKGLTFDTDVVIFEVASFSTTGPDQFWVAFGVGSNCRYIAVHEVVFTLNPTKCLTLPEHHAFTACDTVPSFAGR